MAKCSYCNREVSYNASFCPHCGEPEPAESIASGGSFFYGVFLPAIIGAVLGGVFFYHKGYDWGSGALLFGVLGSNPIFLIILVIIACIFWK